MAGISFRAGMLELWVSEIEDKEVAEQLLGLGWQPILNYKYEHSWEQGVEIDVITDPLFGIFRPYKLIILPSVLDEQERRGEGLQEVSNGRNDY